MSTALWTQALSRIQKCILKLELINWSLQTNIFFDSDKYVDEVRCILPNVQDPITQPHRQEHIAPVHPALASTLDKSFDPNWVNMCSLYIV